MDDPRAVVPGCMSLLEAIRKLSDDVQAFAIDVVAARKEMDALSRELNDLVPLLYQVKDRSVVNSANVPGNGRQVISDTLATCLQVVVGLQVLLRKLSSSKMKRVKWSVSTKGVVEKRRRSIQAYKGALATALALNPLSSAGDVQQKLDSVIADNSCMAPLGGDGDANFKHDPENEAISSVRVGMVTHELPAPKTAPHISTPSSTIQRAQSTEKMSSLSSPRLRGSRTIGWNSSTNSPRPFVKVLSSANRALTSRRKLKLKNSQLVHVISATAPELEAIELLLKGGADPNTCTEDGDSLLKLAATKDHYSVAQLLLKYGADSMKLDADGSSAVEEAFCHGHARTVHVLLKNGARLDSGYGRFGTCLQAAARGGNHELCTIPMSHGADVNISDRGLYGNALQAGVVSRSIRVVEFLLDHGACVNVKGGCYGTCIRAATEIEHPEMCQLLIRKGADVNLVACAGETALLSAVTKENLGICQLLLDAGAAVTGTIMKTSWGLKGKKWDMLRLLAKYGGSVDDIEVPYFGTHLQSYASRPDTDKCKILLEDCNADINANQGHFGTALQAAVNSQSRELVQLLLDHGADPNIMGGKFGSALQAAATCGRVDLCGMLIDAGADVNATVHRTAAEDEQDAGRKASYGGTALHVAASTGLESLIRLLLKRGSSIDTKDSNGNTALHLAAGNGHEVAARLLLENGADATAIDAHGRMALHLAATAGLESLVRLLLEKGSDIDAKDSYKETALDGAVHNQHNAVVQLLVTAKDVHGRTALHRAAAGGQLSLVRQLLKKGSDIDAKDSSEETALDGAVRNKCEAVVQLLVTAKDVHGRTALHRAAAGGHVSLVQRLLENGSDINAKDSRAETALHLAVRNKHDAVVQLLVTATDVHGRTALHRAALVGHESLARLLLESGSDMNAKDPNGDIALHLAARNGRIRVVRMLLEKGANVMTVDMHERTALHEAAAGGHKSLVQLLLAKGSSISINQKDSQGDTALDLAATNGHDAVMRVLLQNGADLGSRGSAMLRAAIRMGDLALVDTLLEKGADANATDANGQTVLQLALLRGRGNIVRLLRAHGAETTTDPHFARPQGRLPPSVDEDTWRAYTTDPAIMAWD